MSHEEQAQAAPTSDPAVGCSAWLGRREPTICTVPAEEILAARRAIESGIEYLKMCLQEHDQNLGRTTLKNRRWGEQMDSDLQEMLVILARLPRP